MFPPHWPEYSRGTMVRFSASLEKFSSKCPAADASALVETIVLGTDGQARDTLDYIGKAQIDSKGTWTQSGDTVTVVLNEQSGQPINQTTTYTVTDGNLVGTNPPKTTQIAANIRSVVSAASPASR